MKTVFFDIDTQLDFVNPSGALYVPGAERILPAVARLNRYAAANGAPVVATVDAHTEDDPEFKVWPHHCVAGTLGQRKPESTLLDSRVLIPNQPAALSVQGVRQIILEKQSTDAFTTVNLPALLESLKADRYVVYGVVTEVCVLAAARGLLQTGRPVTIVTDAIETLNPEDSARTLKELRDAGATLATAADVGQ
jgi:nicotinamidase/pyrazinamidase